MTSQMSQEMDILRADLSDERSTRTQLESSLYQLEKELNQSLADLEYTQSLLLQRERSIITLQSVHRENLSRIASFSAM